MASQNTTLVLEKELAVYGGFDGAELDLGARARLSSSTVLTADVNGDDDGTDSTNSDNPGRVVDIAADTTLDGFTLRGGNGSGAALHAYNCHGILASNPFIRSTTTSNNALVRCHDATMTFVNIVVSDNTTNREVFDGNAACVADITNVSVINTNWPQLMATSDATQLTIRFLSADGRRRHRHSRHGRSPRSHTSRHFRV